MRHEQDGYERTDANTRGTFQAGLWILGIMVVTAALVVPMFRLLARLENASQPPAAEVVKSELSEPVQSFPKLVESEPRVLAAFRAQEETPAHDLRVGREGQGQGADPDRRGDAHRRGARAAEVRRASLSGSREVTRRAKTAAVTRPLLPALALALLPALAAAQMGAVPPPRPATPGVLQEIGFDQRLGEALPLDAPFTDEQGRAVKLGDYFGKRPVVLSFVYYECPMLCTIGLNGLSAALQVLSFVPGQEFEVVTVSFDPKETPALAAAKKNAYLARYQRPGAEAGWHFLTGSEASIAALTRAVGFRYVWDESTKQFAHPAGLVVATPEGRISHYLFGVEYAPKDLRFALVEAASGRIGNAADQLLLYCYQYDPQAGRYSRQHPERGPGARPCSRSWASWASW